MDTTSWTSQYHYALSVVADAHERDEREPAVVREQLVALLDLGLTKGDLPEASGLSEARVQQLLEADPDELLAG